MRGCFVFHGRGAAASFTGWSQILPSEIEVFCVQLPGRGSRVKEKLISSMDELSNQLCSTLLPYMDKPFFVFGHSAGALIVFDLVNNLTKRGLPLPVHVFVSGSAPPHLESESLPSGWLTDDDVMVRLLREWGGTPESILTDRHALGLILPFFVSDLELIDSYRYD